MKITLGLDMDGVLYDWHQAIYVYYQYVMGFVGTYEEFWLDYWFSLSKEKQAYIVSIPIPYDQIAATPQVLDFLNFASERGDIYYITSREEGLQTVTRRYLKRYDFPSQDNLIFTQDKASACSLYRVTHFVDDYEKHVNACSEITKCYLMNKIWNTEAEGNFTRVHNLKELRELVYGE